MIRPIEWHALMERHRQMTEQWCLDGLPERELAELERVRAALDQHDMAVRFCRWLATPSERVRALTPEGQRRARRLLALMMVMLPAGFDLFGDDEQGGAR